MNTKKIKPSLAKKLTAAVMSAAMVFSVAGGASVALRDSGSLQDVKAYWDDGGYGYENGEPILLTDSDYKYSSVWRANSAGTGSYYDAGTFTMNNGKGSMFQSSIFDPVTSGNTKITLTDTTNINSTGVNWSFVDDGVAKANGDYTYIAKGVEAITTDGETVIEWDIKAWPKNQNNVYAPASVSVVDSEWTKMFDSAKPDWRDYALGSDADPWLTITTLGISGNTDHGGMNIGRRTVAGGRENITVNGQVVSEQNPLTYLNGEAIPLYAAGNTSASAFNDIVVAVNKDVADGGKAKYPLYQIPAYINAFWVENDIPEIIGYYSTGRETIGGLRLNEMNSNVVIGTNLDNLATGYSDGTKTYLAEMSAADAAGVDPSKLSWSVGPFGVPMYSENNWNHSMPSDASAYGYDTVLSRGTNASHSVFNLTENFGLVDRHTLNSALGSMDIGNTRTSFTVNTNVKYSIAYGRSRATATIDGSFDKVPVDPDKPDEPDITAAEIKSTTATAANGIAKTIPCATDAVIRDRIVYDGLVDGKTYTVTTSVVDKATGNLLVDSQSSVFVASASKYTDVTINLDTSKYAGKQLVVFETISLNGYEQASHKDLNDADQTVTVASQIVSSEPYIYRTVATNGSSNTSNNNNYNYWNNTWGWTYDKTIPCGANAIINDRVYYEDFIDGETYTITATLYDARTGYALSEVKSPVVQFVANSRVGYVDVKIPFNSTNYAGRGIVVFETVTKYDKDLRREAEVCSHRDLTDPDQTVYVESQLTNQYTGSITKTEATGVSTRNHTLAYSTAAQIRDTVSYKDFTVGNTYTVYTSVYDKSTNVAVVNNKITTHTINSATGTFDVIIDLDSTKYAGKSLVVFETVYLNGVGICYHRDINDANQTVTVANKPDGTVITPNPIDPDPINPTPSNPTEVIGIASNKSIAIDSVNKTHTMSYSVNAEILNRVTYTGLENGSLYTVTSTIVDKATGSAVLNPVSKSFTADSSRGYVEVNIPIDTTQYPNRQLVAYAVISRDGREVSSYKNLNDANATVTIATTSTVLTADNMTSKSVPVSQSVTLVDLVRYEGLTPGQTYKITGHVLHKESANGKDFSTADAVFDGVEGSLVTNGAKVVATQTYEFTPSQASGTATVKFNVNTVGLSGQHLVAVEIIADKDSNAIVCEHKDINDANQTVVVKTSSNVYTGGNDMTIFFIVGSIICVLAAGGVGAFLFIKKRRTNS